VNESNNDQTVTEGQEKRPYQTPRLQDLGPVATLTLGGSGAASEAGTEDENESFP